MSIVGTQSVSMSDLMKLGPQALGAMAQGQMQSIAPSYMVIAALKALTDQQKGAMQPEQQGTVVDKLVAEASPLQAGIGAMQQPVQGFAEGGTVGYDKYYSEARARGIPLSPYQSPEERAAAIGRLKAMQEFEGQERGQIPVGYYGRDNAGVMREYADEAAYNKATKPTQASYSHEPIRPPGVTSPLQIEKTEPGLARASASATARSGISGLGGGFLEKYKEPKAKLGDLKDMPELNAPKNTYLEAAMEKYGKPDEARMKELRDAEESAGLAAFAKGIMNGRGFGGAFGPAAAEYVNAKESKAEKRRAYEDEREKIALELGLRKGTEDYERFMKGIEFQKGERAARYQADVDADKAAFDQTRTKNQEQIELLKANLTAESNRIAAEIRRDGLKAQHVAQIERLYQTAVNTAAAKVESLHGKAPDATTGQMMPNARQLAADRANTFNKTLAEEIDRLNKTLGREAAELGMSAIGADGGTQNRGRFPG